MPGSTPHRNGTLVFVPAWNEEASLPSVLDELRLELPGAEVLVVDDGSTDGTAEVARAGGAAVLSFPENRGLPAAVAAGYLYAKDHGYRLCGRVDADGQHPASELRRLLDIVGEGGCDVAVGSRFASDREHAAYRYEASGPRRLGHFVLRRLLSRGPHPPRRGRAAHPGGSRRDARAREREVEAPRQEVAAARPDGRRDRPGRQAAPEAAVRGAGFARD